jgi:hypothetical protein
MSQHSPGAALRPDDWVYLNCGDRVTVQHRNDLPRPGTIDDVSEDASFIWVWMDGTGRILVTEYDDVIFRVGQNAESS